jgi:phage-related protein
MATFPKLKTLAVAQYPAERQLRFSTHVLEFLDGREQRYSDYAGPLRRWIIRLELLDDTELASLAAFFDQVAPATSFTFTDPWDGRTYPNCSVEDEEFLIESLGPASNRTELTIREDQTA